MWRRISTGTRSKARDPTCHKDKQDSRKLQQPKWYVSYALRTSPWIIVMVSMLQVKLTRRDNAWLESWI